MLSSADGKISTGASDKLDVDKDYPKIKGVCEGLYQYYEIEQTTDLWSLNSGRVQAKMGVNEKPLPEKSAVSFVIIDNSHLNENGVRYFCALSKRFVLVTSNKNHPGLKIKADNFSVIFQNSLDLRAMLEDLRRDFGCERLTVQSGGTLNGLFLREKLLDYIDIVVAPILVGGRDTPTLIDGAAITSPEQLGELGILELIECSTLKNSYVRLRYRVIG